MQAIGIGNNNTFFTHDGKTTFVLIS